MQETETHLLSDDQFARVSSAIASLDQRQLLWLGGYLSGLARSPALPREAPAPQSAAAAGTTILYGSQTGNSKGVAQRVYQSLREAGVGATLVSMADYRTAMLKKEHRLVIVIATHGNGEPPDEALAFYRFLLGDKAPRLERLEYAVLALGDRGYEHFCQTGVEIDHRLKALGATPILDRVDCDCDYEDAAEQWQASVVGEVRKRSGTNGSAAVVDVRAVPGDHGGHLSLAVQPAVFDHRHPCSVEILHHTPLTAADEEKEVLHCELAFEEPGLTYEPGDAVGVMFENPPELIESLLERLEYDGGKRVTVKGEETSLRAALRSELEVSLLTRDVVKRYALAAGNRELVKLEDAPKQLADVARDRDLFDLVTAYPGTLDAQALVDALRPLTPRLYSVASSLDSHPGEAHIALTRLEYHAHGRVHRGVCSNAIAETAARDENLSVYVKCNPSFKLPRDDAAKVIMIGAGTGVVPYRGFLLQREARGVIGNTWLFFGERHFRSSFLYQREWQKFLESGVLERMSVAFSRDQENKDYVQHRIIDEAEAFYEWLRQGAHIYVCGDMLQMAPDVHRAIVSVVASRGRARGAKIKAGAEAEAEQWLAELAAQKRYQKDVY